MLGAFSIGGYMDALIAQNVKNGDRYVEIFFHEATDKYIAGQKIEKVKRFTLYDRENIIIVTDSF